MSRDSWLKEFIGIFLLGSRMAWILHQLASLRGIPQLYCGDEVGMEGGNDPANRRDFPRGLPQRSTERLHGGGTHGRQARRLSMALADTPARDTVSAELLLGEARAGTAQGVLELAALAESVSIFRLK